MDAVELARTPPGAEGRLPPIARETTSVETIYRHYVAWQTGIFAASPPPGILGLIGIVIIHWQRQSLLEDAGPPQPCFLSHLM